MNDNQNLLLELEQAKNEMRAKLSEIEQLEKKVKEQLESKVDLETPVATFNSAEETPAIVEAESSTLQHAKPPLNEVPVQESMPEPKIASTIVETAQAKVENSTNEAIEIEPVNNTNTAEVKSKDNDNTQADGNVAIVEVYSATNTKAPVKKKKEDKKDVKKQPAKQTKKTAAKKIENEKREAKLKRKSKEEVLIANYNISIANRVKGKRKAEPGNSQVKNVYSEVFIFLVDDNELQLKVLQEQFKNTRSFKNTKAFTNGSDLLKYIKTYKFPKNSIFMVVMDYFLENPDNEEAQNGIDMLNKLKEYDPSIEVIMLSSSADVDVAASAAHFGAVTFIQKGSDAFKKVVNNIVWAVHEQEKIRKKAGTKRLIKIGLIGFITIIVTLMVADFLTDGSLGVLPSTIFKEQAAAQIP